MATMPRSMRIDATVWDAAVAKAKSEGTTVTALVEEFLREYSEDTTDRAVVR